MSKLKLIEIYANEADIALLRDACNEYYQHLKDGSEPYTEGRIKRMAKAVGWRELFQDKIEGW